MKKKTTRPTAKQVAEKCGVSVATVSRVLNANYSNGFSVRKELSEKISQVATELGYRPNISAQNLARRKTSNIAFIGYNTTFGWPTNIYQPACGAAIREFQGAGYNVFTAAPNLERENTELPPWRVDGVVVIQECAPQTIEEMERIHLPYVVINGGGGESCSSVMPDDADAASRAMGHLLSLGHKRIAYAGPSPDHRKHESTEIRRRAYLSELKSRSLAPIDGYNTPFTSALDFLVSTVFRQKATAVLAYDHVIAMKLIHDASVLNIQIPRQVSLICFNEDTICDYLSPPLTTVGVPSAEMGRRAAELLLKQIEKPKEYKPEHIKLRDDIVVRSSTAEPLDDNYIVNYIHK